MRIKEYSTTRQNISRFQSEGKSRKEEGGLRTKGYFKQRTHGPSGQHKGPLGQDEIGIAVHKRMEEFPLISVITVTYNSGKKLENTIKSLIGQSYCNIEYIIVDGGSTDSTLNIVKKYDDVIDYWISEQDNGIYDAMNKGIELATGVWINFLNAGDQYFTRDTLKEIFNTPVTGSVVYGSTLYRYDSDHVRIRKPAEYLNFIHGLPFCHQSVFIKASLQKMNKFSDEYKIHADFDLFADLAAKGEKFTFKDVVISSVDCDGVSSKEGLKRLSELCLISKKYNKKTDVVRFGISFVLREFLKIILPVRITRKIQVSK